MKVFGVTGWRNSGKTTLVVNLVKILTARGYRVTTIKHAHHAFDIDKPGKDSFQHREAGASEVMIVSNQRWALLHELQTANNREQEPSLDEALSKLSPCDLVLVEGFKQSSHPKIAVVRPEINSEPLPDNAPNIIAVASNKTIDAKKYNCNGPVLPLDNVEEIADFIEQHCQLATIQ